MNYKNLNLNHQFHIIEVQSTGKRNKYNCTITSGDKTERKLCFFKFSPLLDPVKFMVGKYKDLGETEKTSLPELNENICHKKVLDPNNSAYVDGFFTYLTSNLLHRHKFIHGLDFFGSFLGIKKDFNINIFDDLEYLNDSKYFHENKGKLFEIEAIDEEIFFDADTRNYKKKLKIKINNYLIYLN